MSLLALRPAEIYRLSDYSADWRMILLAATAFAVGTGGACGRSQSGAAEYRGER